MKTRQEIEQQAKEEYKDYLSNPFFTAAPMGYVKGYTQCQEEMKKDIEYWQGEFDHWHQQAMEMTDKKYTFNQITDAIAMAREINGKETYYKYSMEEIINLLNKQD